MHRGCVLVLCLASSVAWADKKIVDMAARFERELAKCEMEEGGLELMAARTRAVVAENPPDKAELAKDLERLARGHQAVRVYCTEVGAMVKFLEANADAPYKKVQKEIWARDKAVRRARAEGRKWIEELAPVTRKLIPRVTQRPAPPPEERKATGKFPSGRIVELPAITGTWKLGGTAVTDVAEFATAGVSATVSSYPFTNATCDHQRKLFASKAGDEPITDLELSDAAKAIAVQWAWRYVRRDQVPHVLTMMCVPVGTGGLVAVADQTPIDEQVIADEMTILMVTMLATRVPKPEPAPTPPSP